MKIAINDLAFQYSFTNAEAAKEKLRLFAEICIILEKGQKDRTWTQVEGFITTPRRDVGTELAPGMTLPALIIQLRNSPKDREKVRVLLDMVLNQKTNFQESFAPFYFEGKASEICGMALQDGGMIVSLQSHKAFCEKAVNGKWNDDDCCLDNISCKEHIDFYAAERLGQRIYHANSKKHKRAGINNYGGSAPASPMDLNDAEAQELLNRAKMVDGHLYGIYDKRCYEFQCEQRNIYHGYQVGSEGTKGLPENIVKELKRFTWD